MWGAFYPPDRNESPHAIPSVGVFVSPTVALCINAEWVGILDGLIARLLDRNEWAGTEPEVDAVIQEVHALLVALQEGNCP